MMRSLLRLVPFVLLAACLEAPAAAAASPRRCEKAVARSVVACVARVADRMRECWTATGAGCLADDQRIGAAVRAVERRVLRACRDGATLAAAGWGAALAPAGLAARAREACLGVPATLVARTFGGPHGAVRAAAVAADARCLDDALATATRLVETAARAQGKCLARLRRGRPCGDASAAVAEVADAATADVAAACPDLKARIGLHPPTYVARALADARCLVASTHGDATALGLDCGPRPGVPSPARGTWTRIVLDSATTGARCGDGSPYAFWLRLAPADRPVGRVLVDLHPGGACFTEAQCLATPASLLHTADGTPPGGGYLHDDPASSPFGDWTKVSLPYCTQDLHVGAGVVNVFPGITVQRHGAVNVRAALAYVRDVLWREMDSTESDGWRPDRLRVLFAGRSAGGWGVRFNYHWVLDELRWSHTTAVPDGGQALDNGQPISVNTLNLLIQQETGPNGWDATSAQPPYCLASNCVGDPLQLATAARLGAVPEQQVLNVTNQYDPIQSGTNLFSSAAGWVNAMRASWCEMRGTTGLFYWLPAESGGFHTILTDFTRYNTVTAGGITVAQWLADAIDDPTAVVDRVDEGTLVADIPGVAPIPCP